MNHSLMMTSLLTGTCAMILIACGNTETITPKPSAKPVVTSSVATKALPADHFDLSHWNITLPLDDNNDGKVDKVKVKDIQTYSHPDFFYMNADGHMVFTAPNKATTTPNSSNTRSELRYMSRGSNTKIKTAAPGNNFALSAHPNACLLYTSPSPRDQRGSRMPSSA